MPAIQAVRRIELENNQCFDCVGTGWPVDENVIATNRLRHQSDRVCTTDFSPESLHRNSHL